MSKRLFGTDGIRGVAGDPPLDRPTVRRFGAALAQVLRQDRGHAGHVVLGRDTRESGPWLRDAVVDGLRSNGAEAVDSGVITTPGLAHVVLSEDYDAGVMISASHNPFRDNGLKVFDSTGMKLSDELEQRVEALILTDTDDPGEHGAPVAQRPELARSYGAWLEQLVTPLGRFAGVRLALDCANGSAVSLAPDLFRHHGADVVAVGTEPDGRNINLDCGSLHLDSLARCVRDNDCAIGIAFDGDADRALAVDRRGRVIDGDYILYLTGRRLHREGRLRGDAIVATIMSNLWLEQRLAAEGVSLHRAPVGDKYVLERMLAEDLVLGGEQSGHVIFRELATTGDGILTGLMLLETVVSSDESVETILDGIVPCPQVQLNVRVGSKPDLRGHPRIGPAVSGVEDQLCGTGRVVLRYSGTEPVARVMVEGEDAGTVQAHAERLAEMIREELGA